MYIHFVFCTRTKKSKVLQVMSPILLSSATANHSSLAAMDSSSLRISKFDVTNFHAWKFKMQMVLEERDLWELVSGEIKAEQCVTQLDQVAYKRKSRKAMAVICLAMEDSQLPLVRSASGAYDAWSRLEDHFEKKSLANKLFLRRRFFTTIMEEGDDVLEHINKLKTLAEQLEAVGGPSLRGRSGDHASRQPERLVSVLDHSFGVALRHS